MNHFETALEELLETSPNNPNPKGSHAPLNHGSMAIETLEMLGYESMIPAWMEEYRSQLGPKPPRVKPIGSNWEKEFGKPERITDWEDYFRQETQNTPWKELLAQWLSRLFPGILADGGHGLIRVAHATRSLERKETTLRKAEFAQALAMWAAHYLTLINYEDHNGTNDFLTAVKTLPIFGHDVDRSGIPPFVEKRLLKTNQEFYQAVMSPIVTDNISESISFLTELGASIYLANADYFPLIFIHTVTIPSALRLILPYLDHSYYKQAIFYVWQAVAASISAYGVNKELQSIPAVSQPSKELVEKAVNTLDEHAIKLVEACIREEKQNPSSVYTVAVRDWVRRLESSAQWNDQQKIEKGLAINVG
jgi:Questin oxidase-like